MTRLLWAVAGAALAVGAAVAEPPPSGRERTLLEQEFHLSERPALRPCLSGNSLPAAAGGSFDTAVRSARRWVLGSVAGRLDTPRTRPDFW